MFKYIMHMSDSLKFRVFCGALAVILMYVFIFIFLPLSGFPFRLIYDIHSSFDSAKIRIEHEGTNVFLVLSNKYSPKNLTIPRRIKVDSQYAERFDSKESINSEVYTLTCVPIVGNSSDSGICLISIKCLGGDRFSKRDLKVVKWLWSEFLGLSTMHRVYDTDKLADKFRKKLEDRADLVVLKYDGRYY